MMLNLSSFTFLFMSIFYLEIFSFSSNLSLPFNWLSFGINHLFFSNENKNFIY